MLRLALAAVQLVERVADRPWSWVEPWDSSAQGWLDFFLRIRAQCFVAGHAPDGAAFAAAYDAEVARLATFLGVAV